MTSPILTADHTEYSRMRSTSIDRIFYYTPFRHEIVVIVGCDDRWCRAVWMALVFHANALQHKPTHEKQMFWIWWQHTYMDMNPIFVVGRCWSLCTEWRTRVWIMYWRHRENAWSTFAAQTHTHTHLLHSLRSVCMNGKCPHTPNPFVVGRIFLSYISVRGRLIYSSTSNLGIFGYSCAFRLAFYDEKFGKYVVPFIAIWGMS